MKSQCTCIIPAHNEAKYIENVLNAVGQIPEIAEIIVVDDGSTDETSALIKRKFPQITLVNLDKNCGKAGAVKHGLKFVKTSHVFLCDADLKTVDKSAIKKSINLIFNQPKVEMVILKRTQELVDFINEITKQIKLINAPKIKINALTRANSLNQISCILSGERVLKTHSLKTIFKNEVDNYNLEIAINQYFFQNQKKVCWIPSSSLNRARLDDLGFRKFAQKYLSMHLSIINHVGVNEYLSLLKNFCNDKCDL